MRRGARCHMQNWEGAILWKTNLSCLGRALQEVGTGLSFYPGRRFRRFGQFTSTEADTIEPLFILWSGTTLPESSLSHHRVTNWLESYTASEIGLWWSIDKEWMTHVDI